MIDCKTKCESGFDAPVNEYSSNATHYICCAICALKQLWTAEARIDALVFLMEEAIQLSPKHGIVNAGGRGALDTLMNTQTTCMNCGKFLPCCDCPEEKVIPPGLKECSYDKRGIR